MAPRNVPGTGTRTVPSWSAALRTGLVVREFELDVVGGSAAGQSWRSTTDRCSIGSHASNDLVLPDRTVSRFHCEITIRGDVVVVRDLGGRNGTFVDGVSAIECHLRQGSTLRIGDSTLRFSLTETRHEMLSYAHDRFGALVGGSPVMRSLFGLLEKVAASDCTVLLEGETGCGKGAAAEAIHNASERRDGPFVVVDCAAVPPNLLESELYGHERGAFTGAVARRIGAFEEANGGTLFLDEIGELSLDLQPKLLRVLEARQVRPVGSSVARPIDVRFIAATNRDLRSEVNAGRFRSDLYYRLAVVRARIPPLRERVEDLPTLTTHLLERLNPSANAVEGLVGPDLYARLERCAWPGNVRELRNYLERCLVFQEAVPLNERVDTPASAPKIAVDVPYAEARRGALDYFERTYVEALLRHHQGRPTAAARAAGLDRVYFYRLLRRHGVRVP